MSERFFSNTMHWFTPSENASQKAQTVLDEFAKQAEEGNIAAVAVVEALNDLADNRTSRVSDKALAKYAHEIAALAKKVERKLAKNLR